MGVRIAAGRPDAPDEFERAVAAAGDAVGLSPIARASQVRPIHDRRLAAIFADRPRREHILLLGKRGRR